MNELILVGQADFEGISCDFFRYRGDLWLTRRQIGEALDYADPQNAIDKMHERNKNTLDQFSTIISPDSLSGISEKTVIGRDLIFYNLEGIFEICRLSNQPKAKEFQEFVWRKIKPLMLGEAAVISEEERRMRRAEILSRTPEYALDYVLKELGIKKRKQHTYRIPEKEIVIPDFIINTKGKIPFKDVYKKYESWCKENNVYKATKTILARLLRERGIRVRNSTGNKLYVDNR